MSYLYTKVASYINGRIRSLAKSKKIERSLVQQIQLFSTTINVQDCDETKKPVVSELPDQANVVIVGGGVIGASVAYHLGQLGVKDVVLMEAHQLTSGTTWHAAGLMNAFGSLSSTSTWMRLYTQQLYRDVLPQQTGLETGWKNTGFIELASDPHRLEQFRRTVAFNHYCGVTVDEITPEKVLERFPLCNISDVLAGFWVPNDGRANPTDVTLALAKGARQAGVQIFENIPVKTVTKSLNSIGIPSVSGVVLESGQVIQANKVVNCAGMWARQFGEACGINNIPNQAAEHYYLITEDIPELDTSWPVVEDSSHYVYIRPEGKGLMLGFFEEHGAAWQPSRIPSDFKFGQLEPDWDRMTPYIERALQRVPSLHNVGIKSLFCGPESFTPDNTPIVGESMHIKNYFIAAGLNSLGILTGGGIGYILAKWISDGHAPDDMDVTAIDSNRFDIYQNNLRYRKERVSESLGNTYKTHFPNHQLESCRNVKTSPLHERMIQANAHMKCTSGWESPAWFAPSGKSPTVIEESFGRENWFEYWQAEHQACRERVALFDMSFMSKFLVQGRDSGKFLNWLSTAQVDGEEEQTTYTQWLNERGYMQADLTVTKLNNGRSQFLVVATDTMRHYVYNHMMQYLSKYSSIGNDNITITDVTGTYAQINLQGPLSRELLQSLTTCDMDKSSFPFRRASEIDVGMGRALCIRITYVGELGYELFIPVEQARRVYDDIIEAGKDFGLQHAGLKALGSLRLEKGYRDYGHDMDNTDTLLECGLGFTCDFNKEIPFVGQAAVLKQKELSKGNNGGLNKRMASVLLPSYSDRDNNDNNDHYSGLVPLMHHGEILWRNGERVSDIRIASYGHTLGGSVGLTMLDARSKNSNSGDVISNAINKSYIEKGDWEVEVGNKKYPCKVSLKPFYDPANLRIKM